MSNKYKSVLVSSDRTLQLEFLGQTNEVFIDPFSFIYQKESTKNIINNTDGQTVFLFDRTFVNNKEMLDKLAFYVDNQPIKAVFLVEDISDLGNITNAHPDSRILFVSNNALSFDLMDKLFLSLNSDNFYQKLLENIPDYFTTGAALKFGTDVIYAGPSKDFIFNSEEQVKKTINGYADSFIQTFGNEAGELKKVINDTAIKNLRAIALVKNLLSMDDNELTSLLNSENGRELINNTVLSPICYLIKQKHFGNIETQDLITKLLEAKIDLNKPSSYMQNPLMTAIKFGDAELCKILLQHGADANFLSLEGVGPLAMPCEKDHILDLLLENGANVNQIYHFSKDLVVTPLATAFFHGSFDSVKKLIDHKADINVKIKIPAAFLSENTRLDPSKFHTILDIALENDGPIFAEKIRLLLNNGAIVENFSTPEIIQVLNEMDSHDDINKQVIIETVEHRIELSGEAKLDIDHNA
jgi:ankyrin repeat protein